MGSTRAGTLSLSMGQGSSGGLIGDTAPSSAHHESGRAALLLAWYRSGQHDHRKVWIEDLFQHFAGCFGIDLLLWPESPFEFVDYAACDCVGVT